MKLTLINDQAAAVPPNYFEVLQSVCRWFGLSHSSYASSFPGQDGITAFATYPPEWQEHYTANGFIDIDPAFTRAMTSVGPVDWSALAGDPNYETVFKDAAKFNVPRSGVTIPVRGPIGDMGIITFSQLCTDAEWKRQLPLRLPHLILTAVYMHESVMAHVQGRDDGFDLILPDLGKSEARVLQSLEEGLDTQEIARSLRTSHKAVEMHLRGARQKLRAITPEHAVARARNFGLLDDVATA